MSLHGRTLAIRGSVDCVEDVLIEGRIDGHIWNENHAVTIGLDAVVNGDIVARIITVCGQVEGTMMATGRVDIMSEARVTGRVVAQRFMLADGGLFSGRVEPQNLDTAMTVARRRRAEKTDGAPAQAPSATPVR
jgi:cytoskeletal protein CcmA (bactofilin family)